MRRQRGVAATREALITALQARAGVNRFLLAQVGSQFCAGDPQLDVAETVWRVPIEMITPGFVAGQVGEAVITSLPVIHSAGCSGAVTRSRSHEITAQSQAGGFTSHTAAL